MVRIVNLLEKKVIIKICIFQQCEQLQQIENDKVHLKAELTGDITNLKV